MSHTDRSNGKRQPAIADGSTDTPSANGKTLHSLHARAVAIASALRAIAEPFSKRSRQHCISQPLH
ncbi:MAG: hypothetical protein AAFX40_06610 [Cyanobacteria bacterium J06639_1]